MDPDRQFGPWQGRVLFAPGGMFAYRPGQVMVRSEIAEHAGAVLAAWVEELGEAAEIREVGDVGDAYVRFTGTFEVEAALRQLQDAGILGQVNHVLFATCGCPPHPANPCADDFYANPFWANPFWANPFWANPFWANPFWANPFWANPSDKNPCCGCGGDTTADPFWANPFWANPFWANATSSPFADSSYQHSGARKSSAKPSDPPQLAKQAKVQSPVRIAILDTGWAQDYPPTGLGNFKVKAKGGDKPDEDGDGFLDPAAGHGTFVAGVIEQFTPGCEIEVIEVLTTYGDGDEAKIVQELDALAKLPPGQRPHLVNLSFGGYSPMGMGALAAAVQALHNVGTVVVASAGNDATCLPMLPAALPHVVGVAARDHDGKPATFTNYGPWVRASTVGVNMISLFYEGFNGASPPIGTHDPDHFKGWALWSGTSFAAPAVVAALAREIGAGVTAHKAVEKLIDDPKLPRHPMLGTEVDPTK